MGKVTITVDYGDVERQFERAGAIPKRVMDDAYKFFKAETPIRSGNARRNTFYDRNSLTIEASYPYAGRLNEGYSQQAPQGMVEPTIEYIDKQVKNRVRGLR